MTGPSMGWMGAAGAVIAVACGSVASRDPGAAVGSAREPLLGGVEAPEAKAIVSVFNQVSIGSCAGALIAPNVIITTRSCISGGFSYACCQDFGATDAAVLVVGNSQTMDVGLSGTWWNIKRVAVPSDAEVCGNDLALLILEKPVSATTAVPLVPRFEPVSRGEVFTSFGYGPTTPQGPDPGQRRKRAGVTVACAESCSGVAPTEWTAGEGICANDGPTVDKEGRLVGVAARVALDCTSAVFESLSAHANFLRTEVKKAATEAGNAPPAWALGSPDGGPPTDPKTGPLDPALCVTNSVDETGGAPGVMPDAGRRSSGGGVAAAVDAGGAGSPEASPGGSGGGCSATGRVAGSSSTSVWLFLGALAFVARRRRSC